MDFPFFNGNSLKIVMEIVNFPSGGTKIVNLPVLM